MTTAYHYQAPAAAVSNSGQITTLYAFYDAGQTAATTNWGFYGLSANNLFSGKLRLGSTVAPTVALDVTGAGLFSTTLGVTGLTTATSGLATPKGAITLAGGATAIAITKGFHVITGDGGGNTVATITGGVDGIILRLLFVDALVTITDTDATTANTVNLSAAFTSSANDALTLIHDGNKWFETGRSIN